MEDHWNISPDQLKSSTFSLNYIEKSTTIKKELKFTSVYSKNINSNQLEFEIDPNQILNNADILINMSHVIQVNMKQAPYQEIDSTSISKLKGVKCDFRKQKTLT